MFFCAPRMNVLRVGRPESFAEASGAKLCAKRILPQRATFLLERNKHSGYYMASAKGASKESLGYLRPLSAICVSILFLVYSFTYRLVESVLTILELPRVLSLK